MKFNLPGLDTVTRAEDGVVMTVMTIDGTAPYRDAQGREIKITLLGRDSAEYRRRQHEAQQRRLKALSTGVAVDAEAEYAAGVDLLVALTKSWWNVVDGDGQSVPCTPANVRALYDAFPAIREQVDAFIGRRENFVLASSTS